MLEIDGPPAVGLDPRRWAAALELIELWCRQGHIPAAGVIVVGGGKSTAAHLFGRQTLSADSPALRSDAIFLIASITKPIVAAAALLLAERGLFALDDRGEEFVPAFGREGK